MDEVSSESGCKRYAPNLNDSPEFLKPIFVTMEDVILPAEARAAFGPGKGSPRWAVAVYPIALFLNFDS